MAQEAALPYEAAEEQLPRRSRFKKMLLTAKAQPLGVVGLFLIAVFIICALFSEIVAPYDPQTINVDAIQQSPSVDHPFGTDRLGRDVLSRTIFGARISLMVGLVAVIIGTLVGSFFGVLSGYSGKWIDSIIQRFIDVLLAFPAVVFLLVIITVIGDEDSAFRRFLNDHTPVPDGTFLGVPVFVDIFVIAVGIGVAVSVGTARVVRGAVLSLKENVYIEAAQAMGASDNRIMRRHILPNVAALIVVLATIFLPVAILAEASISFLGIGVPTGTASWGADLNENRRDAISAGVWWAVFFPGLALSLVVLAFNLVGDAFRDLSDPRLRGGGGPGTGGRTGF
jgi:peptide/nickel transport system permease protein